MEQNFMSAIYQNLKPLIKKSSGFIFKCIKETPDVFFILINDNKAELKIDLMESGVEYYRGTQKKYLKDKNNYENGFYEVLDSSLLISISEGSFGIIQSDELKHLMIITDNYQLDLAVRDVEPILEQL